MLLIISESPEKYEILPQWEEIRKIIPKPKSIVLPTTWINNAEAAYSVVLSTRRTQINIVWHDNTAILWGAVFTQANEVFKEKKLTNNMLT